MSDPATSSAPPAYDPPITSTAKSPRRSSSPSGLPSPPTSPSPSRYSHSYSNSNYRPGLFARSPSKRPLLERSRTSLLDELLPTPTSSTFPSNSNSYFSSKQADSGSLSHVIRRAGSVAVITIFLLSITFMASTSTTSPVGMLKSGAASGLKQVFGVGNQAEIGSWISQDVSSSNTDTSINDSLSQVQDGTASGSGSGSGSDTDSDSEPLEQVKPGVDFDHYKMLKTLPPGTIDISSAGQRLIFIGDIHGSHDPLLRLMDKISYSPNTDRLIHVGDLIAKGSKNNELLWWMNERRILGVRGNHDQTVIQWRGWMEWAGGENWEEFIDNLNDEDDEGLVLEQLKKQNKDWPKGWKWKGEHWKIARNMPKRLYLYLLDLPLVLHLPSLHSIVVHAGLLPYDITKSDSDHQQPLIQFSNMTSSPEAGKEEIEMIRNSEEISLLFDIPQNSIPWNLLNIRSITKKNKVTKSNSKGKPWSILWNKQMKRCNGKGKWSSGSLGESSVEHESESNQNQDQSIENQEDVANIDKKSIEIRQKPGSPSTSSTTPSTEVDTQAGDLGCSPVTVIYGHAAGRGLDIKPFSKGLDTGCVYGRKLTVLVLGDLKGLKGESVRVGDHQGILVSENCGEGGT
ncbi:uncharacterized protein L201_002000 [Kwoniella dendrophila CBS 6074]|uniref:Calcineurin-like phosphoesterase domain-containing protein n=1 Tax=Kwoniella dendrophila CBS 6074 TaxID=1295534 RepID=A0AAX4JQX1_9TREE